MRESGLHGLHRLAPVSNFSKDAGQCCQRMGPPDTGLLGEIRNPSDRADHLPDTDENGERLPREGRIEVERHLVPLEVRGGTGVACSAPPQPKAERR